MGTGFFFLPDANRPLMSSARAQGVREYTARAQGI